MALAQPPNHIDMMRSLLHSIDALLFDTPAHTTRRTVLSQSKIDKGDATWSTKKMLLGWEVDTAAMTMTLPSHRQTRLTDLINEFIQRRRVSRRRWQQLLGELQSMAMAISGAKFHFSLLQHATVSQHGTRIWLTSLIRNALQDWKSLLVHLSNPISLHALVPKAPEFVMGCDASILGVGGWLWQPSHPHHIYVWRHPFPAQIQQQVVTAENPTGAINNSELELVGLLLLVHLASSLANHPYPTLWCASDNIAAVACEHIRSKV
jgi:hypothetical protein